MALFMADTRLAKRLVPGPVLERGHALNLYAHPKEPRLIYGFGKFVVVRSMTDSADNFVYRGHKHAVKVARFSPNGYWVASGDEGGFLRVWSWDNPEHVLKLECQVLAGAILDLDWDPESKRIVVCGDGKGVVSKCVMWDTGNTVGEMVGHTKKAITCSAKPSRPYRIVTGSEDFKVAFYKGPPFKLDHSEKAHTNYVNCARYSKSGAFFVTVGSDKKIVVYDGAEGTMLRELKGDKKSHPAGSVYSCAVSEDEKFLLTCAADKKCTLWCLETNAVVASVEMGTTVADMQMSAVWAHGTVASLALSGELAYLDDQTLAKTKSVFAPQSPIATMCVCDDAEVVVGCNDGTLFFEATNEWVPVNGEVKTSTNRAVHQGKVTALVALSSKGKFASAGFDDKIRFAAKGLTDGSYVASGDVAVQGQPLSLAALPGDKVAVATTKGVCVVSQAQGVEAFEPTTYDATACATTASNVAVGAKDGKIHVFAANDLAAPQLSTPQHRAEITALAYSRDGAKLAAGDADREIKVYAADQNYTVLLENKWRFHTARVTALAWHPDGTHLASTSNDEVIYVWEQSKPADKPVKIDFTHKDGTTALAYLGTTLVSAGNDGNVCFWKV